MYLSYQAGLELLGKKKEARRFERERAGKLVPRIIKTGYVQTVATIYCLKKNRCPSLVIRTRVFNFALQQSYYGWLVLYLQYRTNFRFSAEKYTDSCPTLVALNTKRLADATTSNELKARANLNTRTSTLCKSSRRHHIVLRYCANLERSPISARTFDVRTKLSQNHSSCSSLSMIFLCRLSSRSASL